MSGLTGELDVYSPELAPPLVLSKRYILHNVEFVVHLGFAILVLLPSLGVLVFPWW